MPIPELERRRVEPNQTSNQPLRFVDPLFVARKFRRTDREA